MTEADGTSPADASVENAGRAGSMESKKCDRNAGSNAGDRPDKVPSPVTSNKDNPAADTRNMRRIIAEDPDWSLATVPLLAELCVQHIVENFQHNSKVLNDLLLKHKTKVLERISTDLPLKVTANLVDDEGFWKRCCMARWRICDVSAYDGSWKRMYFERNLQGIIENFVPESTDITELNEVLPLSSNYVQKLDIQQLLPPVKDTPKGPDDDMSDGDGSEAGEGPEIDHFDFTQVLSKLPYLQEFHVTYGVKDCGMNFEWNLFQFTARDCLYLAKCVAACKTLKVFHLHRSKVDDEKVRVLISYLLDHPSLVHLDLSHNLISDRGARAIGKFINNRSHLTKLNICDNTIRAVGAQAIAHALIKNNTLTDLNMRLNRLGDDGGQAICSALLRNITLTSINLGSNDLREPTATILSQALVQNSTLRKIDLSCNPLGSDGGKQLQEGMEENEIITHMDLRLTECGQESEYYINQILSQNRDKDRQRRLAEGNDKKG